MGCLNWKILAEKSPLTIGIVFNVTENTESENIAMIITRGVTTGGRGAQFPGRRIPMGAPKSPNNVTSTFFNTVHLVPKDLRFEHGGVKLASCPGRHLSSLRPWSTCSLKYEIWRRCWRIMKQNKSTSRKSIDTMRNNLDGDVTKS